MDGGVVQQEREERLVVVHPSGVFDGSLFSHFEPLDGGFGTLSVQWINLPEQKTSGLRPSKIKDTLSTPAVSSANPGIGVHFVEAFANWRWDIDNCNEWRLIESCNQRFPLPSIKSPFSILNLRLSKTYCSAYQCGISISACAYVHFLPQTSQLLNGEEICQFHSLRSFGLSD